MVAFHVFPSSLHKVPMFVYIFLYMFIVFIVYNISSNTVSAILTTNKLSRKHIHTKMRSFGFSILSLLKPNKRQCTHHILVRNGHQ